MVFRNLALNICKLSIFSDAVRYHILSKTTRNKRVSYFKFKNNISCLFLDYFSLPKSLWPANRKSLFIHDKQVFEQRLYSCSNGLLDGLDMRNIVIGGGAVLNMLSSSFNASLPFDLDLFFQRSPFIMDDVKRTLKHFENIANIRNVQIHYIIRGMLIEVLIPNERRVQLICTKYKTANECLYCTDMAHVQVYYDGQTVMASYLAIGSLCKGHTMCSRVPLKDVRIDKALTKGFSLRRPFTFTELDEVYCELLHDIDLMKMTMDTNPQTKQEKSNMNLYHDAQSCYKAFCKQMQHRWHMLRWLHHAQHHIINDLDIFDQSMRIFSYNKHESKLSVKNTTGPGDTCAVVGQYIHDDDKLDEIFKEFVTIVFLSNHMTVSKIQDRVLHVIPDTELLLFIDKISKATKTTVFPLSEEGNIVADYNVFGSRCYDFAERPFYFSEIQSGDQCYFTFTVLRRKKRLVLEIVDCFIDKKPFTSQNI